MVNAIEEKLLEIIKAGETFVPNGVYLHSAFSSMQDDGYKWPAINDAVNKLLASGLIFAQTILFDPDHDEYHWRDLATVLCISQPQDIIRQRRQLMKEYSSEHQEPDCKTSAEV